MRSSASESLAWHEHRWVGVACVTAFLIVVALVGLLALPSYGVTMDEMAQRETGRASLYYVAETLGWSEIGPRPEGVPELEKHKDRDYGVAFELPTEAIIALIGDMSSRDVYLLRHALTFGAFLLGVVAVFAAITRRYSDWRWGLLGAAILVLSPRIWADAFYNSKDIVFMAVFAVAMFTALEMVRRPNWRIAALAGVALGIAIDVRIMAVLIPAAALAVLAVRALKRESGWREASIAGTAYLAVAAVVTYALWPWLWSDPIGRIGEAFSNMSKFRWTGVNLYFGEVTDMSSLPWHYAPVWIAITSPIAYLIATVVGFGRSMSGLVRARLALWTDEDTLSDMWFTAMWICPILAVIIFGSTLYDGWRQLFFTYPAMVYLAVLGIHGAAAVVERSRWATALGATVLGCALLWTGGVMAANHPYSNVYFNALAGDDLKTRWALDYWGLSFAEAVQYILVDDPISPQIGIWGDSSNAVINGQWMLGSAEQERAVVVEYRDQASYIINNYNNAFANPAFVDPDYSGFELVHVISVGDEPICSIYRRVR